MPRTTLAIAAVILLGARPVQDDAAKKDLAALQGTWKMAALEVNGKLVPEKNLESATLVIKDRHYVVTSGKNKHSVMITLDPSKTPKEIDMLFLDGANKDRVARGIYRIDKDTFTIVRALEPEQRRPTEFGTWPDTNVFMVTWKRQ